MHLVGSWKCLAPVLMGIGRDVDVVKCVVMEDDSKQQHQHQQSINRKLLLPDVTMEYESTPSCLEAYADLRLPGFCVKLRPSATELLPPGGLIFATLLVCFLVLQQLHRRLCRVRGLRLQEEQEQGEREHLQQTTEELPHDRQEHAEEQDEFLSELECDQEEDNEKDHSKALQDSTSTSSSALPTGSTESQLSRESSTTKTVAMQELPRFESFGGDCENFNGVVQNAPIHRIFTAGGNNVGAWDGSPRSCALDVGPVFGPLGGIRYRDLDDQSIQNDDDESKRPAQDSRSSSSDDLIKDCANEALSCGASFKDDGASLARSENACNMQIDAAVVNDCRFNSDTTQVKEGRDILNSRGMSSIQPTAVDVIVRRSGDAKGHEGNKRFWSAVKKRVPHYMKAETNDMQAIVDLLTEEVHGWGGRFLEKDKQTGQWQEVSRERTRVKILQALKSKDRHKKRQECRKKLEALRNENLETKKSAAVNGDTSAKKTTASFSLEPKAADGDSNNDKHSKSMEMYSPVGNGGNQHLAAETLHFNPVDSQVPASSSSSDTIDGSSRDSLKSLQASINESLSTGGTSSDEGVSPMAHADERHIAKQHPVPDNADNINVDPKERDAQSQDSQAESTPEDEKPAAGKRKEDSIASCSNGAQRSGSFELGSPSKCSNKESYDGVISKAFEQTRVGANKPDAIQTSTADLKPASAELLVYPEDKLYATAFSYHLFCQMQPCVFTEPDFVRNNRKKISLGFPGMACRHCFSRGDYDTTGRFFPSSRKKLGHMAGMLSHVRNHVMQCKECPAPVRKQLQTLSLQHDEEVATLGRDKQNIFFLRIWKRLHGVDSGQTITPKKRTRDAPKVTAGTKPPPHSSLRSPKLPVQEEANMESSNQTVSRSDGKASLTKPPSDASVADTAPPTKKARTSTITMPMDSVTAGEGQPTQCDAFVAAPANSDDSSIQADRDEESPASTLELHKPAVVCKDNEPTAPPNKKARTNTITMPTDSIAVECQPTSSDCPNPSASKPVDSSVEPFFANKEERAACFRPGYFCATVDTDLFPPTTGEAPGKPNQLAQSMLQETVPHSSLDSRNGSRAGASLMSPVQDKTDQAVLPPSTLDSVSPKRHGSSGSSAPDGSRGICAEASPASSPEQAHFSLKSQATATPRKKPATISSILGHTRDVIGNRYSIPRKIHAPTTKPGTFPTFSGSDKGDLASDSASLKNKKLDAASSCIDDNLARDRISTGFKFEHVGTKPLSKDKPIGVLKRDKADTSPSDCAEGSDRLKRIKAAVKAGACGAEDDDDDDVVECLGTKGCGVEIVERMETTVGRTFAGFFEGRCTPEHGAPPFDVGIDWLIMRGANAKPMAFDEFSRHLENKWPPARPENLLRVLNIRMVKVKVNEGLIEMMIRAFQQMQDRSSIPLNVVVMQFMEDADGISEIKDAIDQIKDDLNESVRKNWEEITRLKSMKSVYSMLENFLAGDRTPSLLYMPK